MSNKTILWVPLVLAAFLVASPVRAAELVVNGDFAADATNWHLVGRGTLAHNTDGSGAAGCLEGQGGLAGNATHVIAGQALIPVAGGQPVTFSARVRVISGSPAYCRVALFESERDNCLWIEPAAEVRRTVFSGGWDSLGPTSFTTSTFTRSIEIRLHCATADGDTGSLQVRFDDASVTTSGEAAVIFTDDFETDDTSRWSVTVP